MARLINRMLRRDSERIDQNSWAQYLSDNYFTFQDNAYPIQWGNGTENARETAPNDYTSYINSAYKGNGIVFACCMRRQTVFSEMRFIYLQRDSNGGGPGETFGATQLSVLENPWENGTTQDLLCRALQDVDMCGNHYAVKEGNGKDKPYRIRRLRPDWVDIILSDAPEDAVRSDVIGYCYKPGNTSDPAKWEIYPVDGSNGAIAHWIGLTPDPDAQYRGMSWITPVIREILADKGASLHKQKFFDQGATPQIAVSFKDTVSPEAFKKFMKQLNREHDGVNNAYKTMYLAGGADVTVLGAHLNQLDFQTTQGHGETRIAAAAGIHPVLVGLSEAIKGTPLAIGNYQAAKDMFGEVFLRPMWASLCASYQVLVGKYRGAELWYDDSNISFLRQDRQAEADFQTSQATNINTLVMAGFTPESIIKCCVGGWDLKKLVHSGLLSVQMQKPGEQGGGQTPPPPTSEGPPSEKPVTPTPKEPPETVDPNGDPPPKPPKN